MIMIRADTRDSETARDTCPFFLALGRDYGGYLCAQAGWREPGCCYSLSFRQAAARFRLDGDKCSSWLQTYKLRYSQPDTTLLIPATCKDPWLRRPRLLDKSKYFWTNGTFWHLIP